MNIEELLGKPLSEIKSMSDKGLEAYFAPCLNITRPNLAAANRVEKRINGKSVSAQMTPARKIALSMLGQMGIDLDDL